MSLINYSEERYLVRKWIKYLHNVNNLEKNIIINGSRFYIPFVAIPMSVVKCIFMITNHFNLNPRIKYLALNLFDKYMSYQFWELYVDNKNKLNSESWKRIKSRISLQSKLRLMSCIQIASKIDSNETCLTLYQVFEGLALMDSLSNEKNNYPRSAIFLSEIKVCKTVNFEIPFVTPIDFIEVLLNATNLHNMTEFYHYALEILDFVSVRHQQLYNHLQLAATGSTAKTINEKVYLMAMESDNMFLSSSIIITTLFMFNVKKSVYKDISEKLSKLLDIDASDINYLACNIYSMIKPPEAANKESVVDI